MWKQHYNKDARVLFVAKIFEPEEVFDRKRNE